MKSNEWLVGLCVIACLGPGWVLAQTHASNSSNPKVMQAIAAIKDLCLAGSQYDLQVDAKGNVSLWRLAPGAQGSVSFDVRHSSGAAAIFDDKVRRFADEDIRACIKPYIERIVDAILGGSDDVAWKSREAPVELSAGDLPCPDRAAIVELTRQVLRLNGSGRDSASVAGSGATKSASYTGRGWVPDASGALCHVPGLGMPPFSDVIPCFLLQGS